MPVRRIPAAAAALAAAALGAGIASGSTASTLANPPQLQPGQTPPATKPAPWTRPKAQAYVHFDRDGNILGPSRKVVAVFHPSTGQYCVQLDPSIHVTADTYFAAEVDNFWAGSAVAAQAYSNGDWCAVQWGDPNSVIVMLVDGSRNLVNGAAYVTIP
jgi:hypothetical protein